MAYIKYDNTESINYFEIIISANLYGHRILYAVYLVHSYYNGKQIYDSHYGNNSVWH